MNAFWRVIFKSMRKPKLLTSLMTALACYVLVASVLSFTNTQKSLPDVVDPPESRSEIGTKEDKSARENYLREMLVDPSTGKVPPNIRKKEIAFAKSQRDLFLRGIRQSPAGVNDAQTLDWTNVGPENFGGRTRAIAMDSRDENTLLAGGVSGGVWRSTDLGQSWTKVTVSDQLQSVTAIAQDTRAGQEDTWYYGTGELVGNSARAPGAPLRGDGIYKSLNGGQTWNPLPSTQTQSPGFFNSPFQYVWDMVTDPNSADDVVLAAIFGGIVRSTDGGQTWTTVLGNDLLNLGVGIDLNEVESIFYTDVHVSGNGTFYASLSAVTNTNELSPLGGIYRSDDGINWDLIRAADPLQTRRTEIGSSPSDPNIVYFLVDEVVGPRLYYYDDRNQGQIVVRTDVLPSESQGIESLDSQQSYNLMVKVHPTDPNIVFLGGTNLYRSTDGFTNINSTAWIGGYDPDGAEGARYPGHHPDQHDILFLPSDPNRMISVNDGGVFITDNILAQTVTYSSLNNGFVTTQFYTGSIGRAPADTFVFGGTQDNGSLLANNAGLQADNGVRLIGGDGGFTASTPFGFYYYASFQNSEIYRLTLNNNFQLTSFARVDPTGGGANPGQSYLFINPYVLDPNNSNRMYLAGGDFVWRNRNLSQIPAGSQFTTSVNWDRLDRTNLQTGRVSAIQVSSEPRDIVYYGTSDGRVFKITDANNDLYNVTSITDAAFPEDGYVRSIAIDPTDANHIIVSFSNYGVQSVFRSTDGGSSFTNVSGSLEDNPDGSGNGPSVRWVSIVPITGGDYMYYAATSTGLYSTTTIDGDNTNWVQEASGTDMNNIGDAIVNMIDYRRSDGRIMVATHGRGIFTSRISNVEPRPIDPTAETFDISNIYPNPFVNDVTIGVNVPETSFVRIRIYDTGGNLVRIVSNALAFEGENEFFWDGNNVDGAAAPDGVYLVRITYRDQNEVRRVLLSRN